MTKKVFITRKLPSKIVTMISEHHSVEMWEEENTVVPAPILEDKIKKVDGLLCMLTEDINQELLQKARNLKIISNMAVGYNNIDVEYANKKNIMVTNTPGVLTETTADLTFSLLMATARRITESSEFLRQGKWETWSPFLLTGQDVCGATIGIIGLGKIGEAVAKRAKGFDMNILYHNRTRRYEKEKELNLTYVGLNEILKKSDFIVILVPLTENTKNMIDKEQLSIMKKESILINTSRGGIVNEKSLYSSLKNGEIWAAGLDVFEQEPISLDNPLLTLNNVVTLPHIGSASNQTRLKMGYLAVDNLLRGLNAQKPKNLVNKTGGI